MDKDLENDDGAVPGQVLACGKADSMPICTTTGVIVIEADKHHEYLIREVGDLRGREVLIVRHKSEWSVAKKRRTLLQTARARNGQFTARLGGARLCTAALIRHDLFMYHQIL